MSINQLLEEVEQLPAAEKWLLVKHVLRSLEQEQVVSPAPPSDWHTFLRATYGILRDTPIERPPQSDI